MKALGEKGFVMSTLVKIILIGILVVAIPVSVKLVQEQQILKSRADDSSACVYNTDNGPYPAAEGTSCGDGKVCDGQGQCVSLVVNNPCADNLGNYYNQGTYCGSGKICDGSGNCVAASNPCADNLGNYYNRGTYCGSGKICDGSGNCVAASNPCADNLGNYYDSGTNCGSGKVCDGRGNCVASGGSGGGQPPTGGAPAPGDSGPVGCLADHTAGESWAECKGCDEGVTTCNANGVYSFESVKNPSPNCGSTCGGTTTPPTQVTPPVPGNVGVGTPSTPSTPTVGTQPNVCKIPMASFTGNSTCTMVPNNSYRWVIIQPGTGGAPAIDAAKFGANNACGGANDAAAHAVCPQNTTDPLNVRASTSMWCYEFTEGNRCIQLRHEGTDGGGGGGSGGVGNDTGTCSIDGQSPDLGPTCAACLDSKVPSVVTNIKNMNPNDFNGCSDQKIFNKWCNGFGSEAKGQCDALKAGACASSCGASRPDPGSGTPSAPVRRDLCESTTLSTETLAANGQITITTVAKEAKLQKFRYAFYNLDNGAKIICQQGITSVPDAKPAEQCPNGGMPLVVDKPATADIKTLATTFDFAQFDKVDLSSGNKPTHIQVNGYFIDQFGMQSTANSICSKGFNIVPQKAAAQIKFRVAESKADFTETGIYGWQDYAGPGTLRNFAFKTATPEVKNVWVEFWNVTTGQKEEDTAQIELVAPPSPSPSPAPATTKFYRISETVADFADPELGWKRYDAAPIRIDGFEFKDKSTGPKFVWVEFKDSKGKIERHNVQIRVLGDKPEITSCLLSFEGNNTVLDIKGKNFGSTKGAIKSGTTVLQLKNSWGDGGVQAILPNAQSGQIIPVAVTNAEGQTVEGSCGSISAIALGAKVFCKQPFNHQTDNVDLTLVGAFEGGTKLKQKVSIDKDGIIQGLNVKLIADKDYILSLKAPHTIRKTSSVFRAGAGVTNVPNFVLWVGDIFPLEGGDGLINGADKAELNRQWSSISDAKGRSGDFNQDSRVNSIDWACMSFSMVDAQGRSDDPEPNPGPRVSPIPSPNAGASPVANQRVAAQACTDVKVEGDVAYRSSYTDQDGYPVKIYDIKSGNKAKLTVQTNPPGAYINWKIVNTSKILPNGGILTPDPKDSTVVTFTAPNNPSNEDQGTYVRGDYSDNPWKPCPYVDFAVKPANPSPSVSPSPSASPAV